MWRNEIAHTGHRSHQGEAQEAVKICRSLAEVVIDRLVARFNAFPRTALLLAGHERMRKAIDRNRVDKFTASVEDEEQFFIDLTAWIARCLEGQHVA